MTLSAARVLTPPLQRFPIGLRAANKLVVDLHRHLDVATTGHKFSVAVGLDRTHPVGVAIAGRPVARMLDDGYGLEVLRLAYAYASGDYLLSVALMLGQTTGG